MRSIDKIYYLVASSKTDEALDFLYDIVDSLLTTQSFYLCDQMLVNIDLSKMSVDTLIGALSITLSAKQLLPSRPQFFQRVEKHLTDSLSPQQAAELLDGLQ